MNEQRSVSDALFLSVARTGIYLVGVSLFIFLLALVIEPVLEESIYDGSCNVAVIPIKGEVLGYGSESKDEFDEVSYDTTSPESVRAFLDEALLSPYIEAIIYDIDTGGGSPIGGERIQKIIKDSPLPTVALVGDLAASSGYMAASAADRIIASPFSEVGHIGVTASYSDYSIQNEQSGITYNEIVSGTFKDTGSSEKPLTEDERKLFEHQIAIMHEHFIDMVAENRSIPREEVVLLAHGGGYVGGDALTAKLIDELGDVDTARSYLASVLEKEISDIVVCQ